MSETRIEPHTAEHAALNAWPRRFALWTWLAAVPLVLFGGTVTTLHAGLAIDGWLVLEPGRGDWFLWTYPVDHWFRDPGTFTEHTHRLFGSLVGLLAIATVVVTFVKDSRRASRVVTVAALLAVTVQGTLGGLRVLQKSDDLAFLHGAIAQAVFALLGVSVIVLSKTWKEARRTSSDHAVPLRRIALATAVLVYAQIVVGAWLRHGPSASALILHGALAFAVVGAVLLQARALRHASAARVQGSFEADKLAQLRKKLLAILCAQFALGILAFISVYFVVGRDPSQVSQALFPTLHVIGGAALLLQSVANALWSARLAPARDEPRREIARATSHMETAR